jgi:hypothetical protein
MAKSESGIGGIVKIAAIAGLAYWVYETFYNQSPIMLTAPSDTGNGGGNGTNAIPVNEGGPTAPPPPPMATPILNPQTTRDRVLAAATADGFSFGTVDQWDYFYNKVRGSMAAPDPISAWGMTDAQRMTNMTFDEWWNLAQSKGLSGVGRGGRGLGQILDMSYFFANGPHVTHKRGNFR